MTKHHAVPALALLASCAGGATDPAPTEPVDVPSPYIVDEGPPPAPTATLAEVETALQEALDVAFTVHGAPVQDAYDQAMTGASENCPYVYATPEGTYWYDSCVSDNGTAYDGYVFSLAGEDIVEPYSGAVYDYWYAFGGATVVDGDGHTLELGGGAVVQAATATVNGVEVVTFYSEVEGTFAWDGAEASGTWLETDIDPDLVLYAYAVPAYEASYVELAGGFGGILDGWAVAFDGNAVGSDLLELPCPVELSGSVGVRAPDGTWTDVLFDGTTDPYDTTFDPVACDGCGEAYFLGEPLGEVCVDVSILLASAVRPW